MNEVNTDSTLPQKILSPQFFPMTPMTRLPTTQPPRCPDNEWRHTDRRRIVNGRLRVGSRVGTEDSISSLLPYSHPSVWLGVTVD